MVQRNPHPSPWMWKDKVCDCSECEKLYREKQDQYKINKANRRSMPCTRIRLWREIGVVPQLRRFRGE